MSISRPEDALGTRLQHVYVDAPMAAKLLFQDEEALTMNAIRTKVKQLVVALALTAVALPHLKSGLREAKHGYREYYDEPSRAIVSERHQNDIRLFGYEF